jgi:hypothetical protein
VSAAAAAEGYRARVAELAPSALFGRDAELLKIADFCESEEPFLWWLAGPWSGKTALMAHFATHPPDGVEVVSFFIRAAIAAESNIDGYLQNVIPQLATVAGDLLPSDWSGLPRLNYYRHEILRAAAAAAGRGRRLAIVVDGLDEDGGSPKVLSLVPRDPHPAIRFILSSRAAPGVEADLTPDHPLRTWPKRTLAQSEKAVGIGEYAQAELARLLNADAAHREVIGFITAARGALTFGDLAELTGKPPYAVRAALEG